MRGSRTSAKHRIPRGCAEGTDPEAVSQNAVRGSVGRDLYRDETGTDNLWTKSTYRTAIPRDLP